MHSRGSPVLVKIMTSQKVGTESKMDEMKCKIFGRVANCVVTFAKCIKPETFPIIMQKVI